MDFDGGLAYPVISILNLVLYKYPRARIKSTSMVEDGEYQTEFCDGPLK